jgi:hypothetical protein
VPESTELLRDLTELGRSLPTPGAAGMDEAVMARLDEREPSTPWSSQWRVRAVAIGLAIVVALLAAPPVRAAVADWFGFGAVVVRTGDDDGPRSGPSVAPPPVSPGLPLAQAAAQVEFDVFELPALGEPAGAEVSADGRVLSVAWDGGPRLDQSSSLSYTFDKSAGSVEFVSVRGRDALWFGDSHEVVLLDESGARIPQTDRPAGRTLIWTIGDTTLRLEGDLSLAQALGLAESARRYR